MGVRQLAVGHGTNCWHLVAERVGFEPTVPVRYSGFRDRPIQPLSHLSGFAAWRNSVDSTPADADRRSAAISAASGRSPDTSARQSSSRTPRHGREAVVERQCRVEKRADGAAFGVGGAVDHGRHARVHDGADAHEAGLDRHVEGGARQPVVAEAPRPPRAARRPRRGRSGRSVRIGLVEAAARPRRRPHDDRAHRHLAASRASAACSRARRMKGSWLVHPRDGRIAARRAGEPA